MDTPLAGDGPQVTLGGSTPALERCTGQAGQRGHGERLIARVLRRGVAAVPEHRRRHAGGGPFRLSRVDRACAECCGNYGNVPKQGGFAVWRALRMWFDTGLCSQVTIFMIAKTLAPFSGVKPFAIMGTGRRAPGREHAWPRHSRDQSGQTTHNGRRDVRWSRHAGNSRCLGVLTQLPQHSAQAESTTQT